MEFIKTLAQLEDYLKAKGHTGPYPNIAVEALIFNGEGKLTLVLRGGHARDERFKLEGIGGRVNSKDKGDLTAALLREIAEEIGERPGDAVPLTVQIDRLLEVRLVKFQQAQTLKWADWVVVSYLCRIVDGTPFNREPDKHIDIKYLSLDELFAWQEEPAFTADGAFEKPGLSKSLILGRAVYRRQYGNRPYYETEA